MVLIFLKYFIQNTMFGYFSSKIKAVALGTAGVRFISGSALKNQISDKCNL